MIIPLATLLSLTSVANAVAPPPVAALSDVTKAVRFRFAARDGDGRGLDCLQVVPLGRGDTLGVYHSVVDGHLVLHLGHSSDLFRWSHLQALDTDASQGTLHRNPDGSFLLAYEKAEPNSVWIRLRYYPSLESLKANRFTRQRDLPRTLAPTAEGTPSFDRVEWRGSQENSVIRLRFHYFRNGDVDRAAVGTLKHFKDWTTHPDNQLNRALERLGVTGNIGDRERFAWQGRDYFLQEGQGARLDWRSWRIYLYDPKREEAWPLPLRTSRGSVAFANPSIAAVTGPGGTPLYVVTLFLPAEGSGPGEAGELIYTVRRPKG